MHNNVITHIPYIGYPIYRATTGLQLWSSSVPFLLVIPAWYYVPEYCHHIAFWRIFSRGFSRDALVMHMLTSICFPWVNGSSRVGSEKKKFALLTWRSQHCTNYLILLYYKRFLNFSLWESFSPDRLCRL